MLTMYTNVHFSRRKDFIVIQDEAEDVLWTGREVIAAFRWMLDKGHYSFILAGPDQTVKVIIGRVTE